MKKVELLESENNEKFDTIKRLEKKNEDNEKDIRHLQGKIDELDKSNRENETSYNYKYDKVVNDISEVMTQFKELKENWGILNKELETKLTHKIKDYDSKLQNLSIEIRNELAQANEKYDSLGITYLIMLIIFDNKAILFFDW